MDAMVTIEEITPELRHELRCRDARAYAKKLRRHGIDHGVILLKVEEIWGGEVSQHIEMCKGGYYYLPDEDDTKAIPCKVCRNEFSLDDMVSISKYEWVCQACDSAARNR